MSNPLDDVVGFQWDEGNVDKNWVAQGVENWECEQMFFNEPVLVLGDPKHSETEKRWAVFGSTDGERLLTVVFTRREKLIRVISARDMSRKERSFYEKTK